MNGCLVSLEVWVATRLSLVLGAPVLDEEPITARELPNPTAASRRPAMIHRRTNIHRPRERLDAALTVRRLAEASRR
jgi:hypothetical protein